MPDHHTIRFRGDVEGLRAVAVLLVVLAHMQIPGFHGGFVGVDVFFVLSGYLITSLLAAEYGAHGSISIRGFYGRRARRILPAALTVVAAVVAAGDVMLNELRIVQIHHDAVWALAFASNVNFVRQTTDYFAQDLVGSSPFQHYWSLAVEEQFYLVWPALFLLAARLRVGHWRARVALSVCAVGSSSLAWSIVSTQRSPASAYFSTFTRTWELALGCLIGIATTSETRLPRRLARAASAAGVALFAAAGVVIGPATPFPGAAALLPTLATALLILGGLTDRLPLANRALCLAPFRFLGRISYSLYLWHWPLIVFAASLYPTMSENLEVRLFIFLSTLIVATLSYYLIERPGRRIGAGHGARVRRNLATAMVGACALVAAFLGLSALDRELPVVEPAAAAIALPAHQSTPIVMTLPRAKTYAQTVRAWQDVVRAGLSVRRLPPSLRPLSPHLSMGSPPPCIQGLAGVSASECVVGNPHAANVAVLDGDSHAEMFRNAVWRAFDPKAWSIHIFARDACGWAGSAENAAISTGDCARLQAESVRRIHALHPDVLLLSEHLVVTSLRSSADIASSLHTLTRSAAKTIVLGHTPLPHSWSTCLAGDDVTRCFAVLDAAFLADRATEQRLAKRAGAMFVDTSAWLCVRAGEQTVCPPVIDGVPAYKDTTHVGPEYQFKLIPIVRALLRSAGVDVGGRR